MNKRGAKISGLILFLFLFGIIIFLFPSKEMLIDKEATDSNNTKTLDVKSNKNNIASEVLSNFISPLSNIENRIIKKYFGTYVTPRTSPIQPERFSGYHTGVDLEVFSDELNKEIEVKATCFGKIVFKGWVKGYGGVLIQECELRDEKITVLYGHLDVSSSKNKVGDSLVARSRLGFWVKIKVEKLTEKESIFI